MSSYIPKLRKWVKSNAGNMAFVEGCIIWSLNPSKKGGRYGEPDVFGDISWNLSERYEREEVEQVVRIIRDVLGEDSDSKGFLNSHVRNSVRKRILDAALEFGVSEKTIGDYILKNDLIQGVFSIMDYAYGANTGEQFGEFYFNERSKNYIEEEQGQSVFSTWETLGLVYRVTWVKQSGEREYRYFIAPQAWEISDKLDETGARWISDDEPRFYPVNSDSLEKLSDVAQVMVIAFLNSEEISNTIRERLSTLARDYSKYVLFLEADLQDDDLAYNLEIQNVPSAVILGEDYIYSYHEHVDSIEKFRQEIVEILEDLDVDKPIDQRKVARIARGAEGEISTQISSELVNVTFSIKGVVHDAKINLDATEFLLEELGAESIDLSNLRKSLKLREIWLGENRIEHIDLTPVGDLPELKLLELGGNHIKSIDLNPLSRNQNLQSLSLSDNEFDELDLSPLANCKRLKQIDVSENSIKRIDISPLLSCPLMEEIVLDPSTIPYSSSSLKRSTLSPGIEELHERIEWIEKTPETEFVVDIRQNYISIPSGHIRLGIRVLEEIVASAKEYLKIQDRYLSYWILNTIKRYANPNVRIQIFTGISVRQYSDIDRISNMTTIINELENTFANRFEIRDASSLDIRNGIIKRQFWSFHNRRIITENDAWGMDDSLDALIRQNGAQLRLLTASDKRIDEDKYDRLWMRAQPVDSTSIPKKMEELEVLLRAEKSQ